MQKKVLLNANQIDIIINRLVCQLIENHHDFSNTVLIGLQPRGVLFAQKILSNLFIQAHNKGCSQATLEVKSNDPIALALYKSVGFITKGNRPCYYKNGSDALIQWYSLNEEKSLD